MYNFFDCIIFKNSRIILSGYQIFSELHLKVCVIVTGLLLEQSIEDVGLSDGTVLSRRPKQMSATQREARKSLPPEQTDLPSSAYNVKGKRNAGQLRSL